MRKYFSDKNFLAGVLFFFVSLGYLFGAYSIETKGIVAIESDFMPKIYGYILMVTSLILIVTSWKRLSSLEEKELKSDSDIKRVLAVLFLILVYILCIEWLGFIFCSIPFLFFLSLLLTPDYVEKKYWVYVLFSVLLPIIAYFGFSYYLNLTMPSGIFF
ncbi:tripartite tricarboxylate transporter TctB family protein [Gallibacterium anatis]|uniref:tripartite tricarboxylate transporter TctB family protein n=1 Tax=Gallibacterium anatis TaxID=750 RepID=UPI002550A532|nr:tripartite tricarboxylate transporter TctB family protein [Gallibacterium anatis]WIM83629.1 tripartite tricarboxylate transporter TctB family protein [Gallibacterium anatis]WKS96912.1 tripartite tricarboxylate transporter TctB family protein [Gallibacterium anatis]